VGTRVDRKTVRPGPSRSSGQFAAIQSDIGRVIRDRRLWAHACHAQARRMQLTLMLGGIGIYPQVTGVFHMKSLVTFPKSDQACWWVEV
jgi:hypothetical protein